MKASNNISWGGRVDKNKLLQAEHTENDNEALVNKLLDLVTPHDFTYMSFSLSISPIGRKFLRMKLPSTQNKVTKIEGFDDKELEKLETLFRDPVFAEQLNMLLFKNGVGKVCLIVMFDTGVCGLNFMSSSNIAVLKSTIAGYSHELFNVHQIYHLNSTLMNRLGLRTCEEAFPVLVQSQKPVLATTHLTKVASIAPTLNETDFPILSEMVLSVTIDKVEMKYVNGIFKSVTTTTTVKETYSKITPDDAVDKFRLQTNEGGPAEYFFFFTNKGIEYIGADGGKKKYKAGDTFKKV
jgi:hypothetical protein